MKLSQETKNLLLELEYEIGSETYNPNSYNGWTGDEGCAFKYPVSIYCGDDNTMLKVKSLGGYYDILFSDSYDISIEQLKDMRYKFGSNELYIGRGILNLLTFLEDRYNLDFDELERNYQEDSESQGISEEDNFCSRHHLIVL